MRTFPLLGAHSFIIIKRLNRDGQQYHKYQHNEQSPFTFSMSDFYLYLDVGL